MDSMGLLKVRIHGIKTQTIRNKIKATELDPEAMALSDYLVHNKY